MLSLYVHTPFCVKKCRYCGFYSTVYSNLLAEAYLMSLEQEASTQSEFLHGRGFETVYIGGGTPTVLSPRQLERLLSALYRYFTIASGAELTIEANPTCLSWDHLTVLRNQGVTRLSLGVQSFSDAMLSFLGRTHTATAAVDAFRLARHAGIDNISIDLIYGIPDQTDSQWRDTLKRGVELEPEHISAYSLSLDDGSLLKAEADAGTVVQPDDERVAVQYEFAQFLLEKAGYEQYEISNFCRPGRACRHNMNYWQRGDYIGLGPGAFSFIDNRRYRNVPDVREYCERISSGSTARTEVDTPDNEQSANETVMLALRTAAGLDLERYEQSYGSEYARTLRKRAARFRSSGLIELETRRMRLSPRGFLVANEVLARLIS
jgi:oxygen-independent coproporphyrinogen-3 oxidase